MDTTKKIYIFLIVITVVVVAIYAQSIIIPFILAVLFWFIIRVIKKLFLKIKFLQRWPQWLLTILSSFILLVILYLAIDVITTNIQQLSAKLPEYQANVSSVTLSINEKFDTDLMTVFSDYAKDFDFSTILSSLLSALTGLFGNTFTILLYMLFLLLEEPILSYKLKAMYPDEKRLEHVKTLIGKIDTSVGSYIALKTIVSLITGVLSYTALLFIGVDAPAFWAFLIFILNFIPTIGSLIATTFPTIFALLQFGEITPAILVLGIVGAIQLIVGNLIEPKLMGNTLNISPLVVFIALAVGGVIWGITGMLLSVPITVVLIIIMSEFPETRSIAILLSQKGILNK
jgi:predicted PurR-regulated permease PerM